MTLPTDTDNDQWRCGDCQCLNADHEAFCFRCGAGPPEEPMPIYVEQLFLGARQQDAFHPKRSDRDD